MSLKQFDLFPKIKEESRRTTNEGGMISLVGIVLGLLLLLSETNDFIRPRVVEQVDLFDPVTAPGVPQTISIHLEIDFFHLSCDVLTLGFTTATTTEENPGSWEIRESEKKPSENNEGCLLNARVELLKYESGEMHVELSPHALPGTFQQGFSIEEYFRFNSSHLLKHFSFSSTLQKETVFSPKIVPELGTGRYIYDFSVVPEKPHDKKGEVDFVFQCREQDVVTHNQNEGLFALQKLGLPGVFFTVKLSNLMLETYLVEKEWYAYLISVIGIFAGTAALVAFVDSLLHEALWKKKLD